MCSLVGRTVNPAVKMGNDFSFFLGLLRSPTTKVVGDNAAVFVKDFLRMRRARG